MSENEEKLLDIDDERLARRLRPGSSWQRMPRRKEGSVFDNDEPRYNLARLHILETLAVRAAE